MIDRERTFDLCITLHIYDIKLENMDNFPYTAYDEVRKFLDSNLPWKYTVRQTDDVYEYDESDESG